jgi:hypothetical protein
VGRGETRQFHRPVFHAFHQSVISIMGATRFLLCNRARKESDAPRQLTMASVLAKSPRHSPITEALGIGETTLQTSNICTPFRIQPTPIGWPTCSFMAKGGSATGTWEYQERERWDTDCHLSAITGQRITNTRSSSTRRGMGGSPSTKAAFAYVDHATKQSYDSLM